jgi:hypothetical protein
VLAFDKLSLGPPAAADRNGRSPCFAAMTASACSAAFGDVSGGVVHRSSCRLDLVVSVWLDVLTRPKVEGGCPMGARRVDREMAESVAVMARQRLVR